MSPLLVVGGILLGLIGLAALLDRWGPRWVTRWRAMKAERDTRDRLRRRSDALRGKQDRDAHRW